jgi:hypothetical protein
VLTGVPLDCAGADAGACRPPELLEELELLDERESFDGFESSDEPELPEDECELPDDLVPDDGAVPDDPVVAEAFVAPGNRIATSPATATLAAEIAAVVLVSQRRPRSRSATARATSDAPLRNCGLLIVKA